MDDNPAVLRLLGTLFKEEGIEVALAESAKAAREQILQNGRFDLVLSDISMPGETGFDLLEWIKSHEDQRIAELPVLLTTAQLPEAENRVKGLSMGAVDYIVRPIELSELALRAIHAIRHFQRVRALQASLEDSENLATVGRMLAASNHEIKNLAAVVRSTAQLTARIFSARPDLGPQEQKLLGSLESASSLLAQVTRGFGQLLHGASETPMAPVRAEDLASEVRELLTHTVRPIAIESKLAGEHWVMASGVLAKQVLINFVLNASDAIKELAPEEGGHIVLTVKGGPDGCVDLQVTDNGIGLPEAGTREVFAAFATTKKLRGGQGLGLWFSAELARRMSGKLFLSSPGAGQGATATLRLPVTDERPLPDAEDEFAAF